MACWRPNPYEFDQELIDIKQIEVLKGPQGALYGRDAIGGAIIIQTEDPADHFEGTTRLGIGNGLSEKAQVAVSGPIDAAGTLTLPRLAQFLQYRRLSARIPIWTARPIRTGTIPAGCGWCGSPTMQCQRGPALLPRPGRHHRLLLRHSAGDEANPFSSFTTPPNANDVTSPIQTTTWAADNRDITDAALKLDFNPDFGTFTSTSDYNHTKEIDTGDAYDFRPDKTSIAYNYFFAAIPAALGGPPVRARASSSTRRPESQELRFTSNKIDGFSWIAGAYYVHTERFISTDNLCRSGRRACRAVYETPLVDPTNPFATNTNVTFLADSQNNNAWAVFADATYEFNPQWELDAAIRYDRISARTPPIRRRSFLPDPTALTPARCARHLRCGAAQGHAALQAD